MKKFLQKTVSICSALLLMANVSGTYAMIDAPDTISGVWQESDFSTKFFSGSAVTNVIDSDPKHGGVDKIGVSADYAYPTQQYMATSDNFLTESQEYTLSFDFKAAQTNKAFKAFLRTPRYSKLKDSESYLAVYTDFAYLAFDAFGNIVVSKDGSGVYASNLTGTYSETGALQKIGTYEADKWNTIEARIFAEKDAKNSKIEWYLNGNLSCTSNLNRIESFVDSATNKKNYLDAHFGQLFMGPVSKDANDTTTAFYIDNYKLYDSSVNDNYYAKVYASTMSDGYVKVSFNETPSGDMTGAVIKDLYGNTISKDGATQQGRYLYVPIDVNAIESSTEYTVILPSNVPCISGKALANDALVFTSPEDVTFWLYNQDHSSFAAGALGTNDNGFAGNLGYQVTMNAEYDTDAAYGTVLKATSDTAPQYIRVAYSNKSTDTANYYKGWTDYNNPLTNKVAVTFDIKTEGKRTPDITLRNAHGTTDAKDVATCWFDAESKFVYKSGTALIKNDVTANDWHNVRIVYDKTTCVPTYYLDGKNIGSATAVATENNAMYELRFTSVTASLNNTFWLDNIKIGYEDAKLDADRYIAESETGYTLSADGTGYKQNTKILSVPSNAEVSGDYIFSVDITTSTLDWKSAPSANQSEQAGLIFHILNSENKKLVSALTTDTNGTLAINKSAGGTDINGSKINSASSYKAMNLFKANKSVNITTYFDNTNKKIYVYANKQLVAVNDYPTTIDNFRPVGINTLFDTLSGNSGTATVGNMKFGCVEHSTGRTVSARINSDTDEYTLFGGSIPYNAKEIELTYNRNVSTSALPSVTITNKADNNTITAGTVRTDGTKLIIGLNGKMPNGDYTLSVPSFTTTDGNVMKSYNADFKINTKGMLVIDGFDIVDKDGNTVTEKPDAGEKLYVKANITNTNSDSADVKVIIAGYAGIKLKSVNVGTVNVEAMGSVEIGHNSEQKIELSASDDITEYNAFIWDSFENCMPYETAIVK